MLLIKHSSGAKKKIHVKALNISKTAFIIQDVDLDVDIHSIQVSFTEV
jgi:hypothetical protein